MATDEAVPVVELAEADVLTTLRVEVIPYTRNSFSLVLDDAAGTEIPLSKSAAGELRELLGY